MSISLSMESDNFFVLQVKGIYTFEDQREMQKKARAQANLDQKVKVLIMAESFDGWGKEGDWGDITFMMENDPFIEKIAVIARDEWKDEFLMFLGAGMRQAEVQFFSAGSEDKARAWLG